MDPYGRPPHRVQRPPTGQHFVMSPPRPSPIHNVPTHPLPPPPPQEYRHLTESNNGSYAMQDEPLSLTAAYKDIKRVMLTPLNNNQDNNTHDRMEERDLDNLKMILQMIMQECSRTNIESGKSWVFKYCREPKHLEAIVDLCLALSESRNSFLERLHLIYLVNDILFHSDRRQLQWMKDAILPRLVPLLRHAYHYNGITNEMRGKVIKVITIWNDKHFFDTEVIDSIKENVIVSPPPTASLTSYDTSPLTVQSSSGLPAVAPPPRSNMSMTQFPHHVPVPHFNPGYRPPFPPPPHSGYPYPPHPHMRPPPPMVPGAHPPPPPPPGIMNPHLLPPTMPMMNLPPRAPHSPLSSMIPPHQHTLSSSEEQHIAQNATPEVCEKQYHELPAGLMVSVVEKNDEPAYSGIDPSEIQPMPSLSTPSSFDDLTKAVEEFYEGLDLKDHNTDGGFEEQAESKLDRGGWEPGYLDSYYESLKEKRRGKNSRRRPSSRSPSRSGRERSRRRYDHHYSRNRSRSQSPVDERGRSTERNYGRSHRHHYHRSQSPYSRSRSRDSYRSSRSRSSSPYPTSKSRSDPRNSNRYISRSRSRSPPPPPPHYPAGGGWYGTSGGNPRYGPRTGLGGVPSDDTSRYMGQGHSRGHQLCYNCSKPGHFARDCPESSYNSRQRY